MNKKPSASEALGRNLGRNPGRNLGRNHMRLRVTILPGDGIGQEVCAQALRILRGVGDFCGYEFRFEERPIGGAAIRASGTPLPPATLDACLESDAVLLGAVGSPEFDELPRDRRPEAGLLQLRQALGGYANLRPAVWYQALADCSPLRPVRASGADVLIVRELLGGLYFGEPRGIDTEAAFNTMRYTVAEIERIAHVAFREARRRRKKVTSVDKANVLETSQLWRRVVSDVAGDYPDVALEHMYVDACAMHLVSNPRQFDVILTENLFGDVLSDEAAVITGSLGMLASATIGGQVNLYEPVHGSAPNIAGRGIANPLGAIASAAMLLRYSASLDQEASAVEQAIVTVLESGQRTHDLSPPPGRKASTTDEMGAAVERELADALHSQYAYHAV
jgi:3-isopropylmalate dehydrogenase